MDEQVVEELSRALCSDREIEAYANLTPLEKSLLGPINKVIEHDVNILLTSVGVESSKRYALCLLALGNCYLHGIEVYEAEKTKCQ